jgi:hypothetical protein
VLAFVPAREVIKLSSKENDDEIDDRISRIIEFNKKLTSTKTANSSGNSSKEAVLEIDELQSQYFSADEISQLKESFGKDFLTENYYLQIEEI